MNESAPRAAAFSSLFLPPLAAEKNSDPFFSSNSFSFFQPHTLSHTGNGSPSLAAPRPWQSSLGLNTVREIESKERDERTKEEKEQRRCHQTTPRTRTKEKLIDEIKTNHTTGLVGILPKLWEKDLHRIITGWANEFGPVFKLRVMQFHVSLEFFCFLVFSVSSKEKRRVASHPPSRSSTFSLSFSLSLPQKTQQAIVITDPALATHVCRSKLLDKFRFQYHFMDEVRRGFLESFEVPPLFFGFAEQGESERKNLRPFPSKNHNKTTTSYQFLGGLNVLTGPTNAHWKAVRKGVAPAFSAGCMKAAFGHVVDRCGVVSEILDGYGPDRAFNVDDLLLRESMDVIGRVGFQKEMGALAELRDKVVAENKSGNGNTKRPSTATPVVASCASAAASPTPPACSTSSSSNNNNKNDTVGSYVRTMLECTHEIERRLAEPHRAKFYWKKSVREGHAKMTHWKNIVRENLLEHIKNVAPVKGSFADLLLKVRDPATGAGLSDAKLLPEITALFFAGTDTTGHTGTWTLYLLSQHPEAEQKALDELRAAGLAPTPENPTPRALEYADLGKLVYCQAIVKGKSVESFFSLILFPTKKKT